MVKSRVIGTQEELKKYIHVIMSILNGIVLELNLHG